MTCLRSFFRFRVEYNDVTSMRCNLLYHEEIDVFVDSGVVGVHLLTREFWRVADNGVFCSVYGVGLLGHMFRLIVLWTE